jgi:putative ABC transport system permease protein
MKRFAVSPANYLDWRNQNSVFESMAVIGGRAARVGGTSRPLSMILTVTEPDFFKALRMPPILGRAFTTAECQPGHDDVVVLTSQFAAKQFGGPHEALGNSIELNGRTFHVIGIMPPDFELKSWFPASSDGIVPVAWTPKEAATRGDHNYSVVARLRPGVTVAMARSDMSIVSERLANTYPNEDKGWGATVGTLRDELVGDVRPALLTLLGAVSFVLLIACANTANLVLARTATRRKELAIRAALGAGSVRAMFPGLVETMVLALTGGALGLVLARSAQSLVLKALAAELPRSIDVSIDLRVLVFTAGASVFTGLAAGLIAGWRLLKIDLNEALKQGLGKTDAYSGGTRTHKVLVAAEAALSLLLLVGAGLMVRSLWALREVNPGFVSANVITMGVPIPKPPEEDAPTRFYSDFLPQVQNLPGVVSAAAVDRVPLGGGGSQQPVTIEGRPAEVFALQPTVAVRAATPGYFHTMQIPLLAGRDFNQDDTIPRKDRGSVLISQSMARQFWPGESPIGKRLRLSFSPEKLREVVGVVGDVKEFRLDALDPVTMLYQPLPVNEFGYETLVVRVSGDTGALVPAITRVLAGIDPQLSVRKPQSMDQLVAAALSQNRFSMLLFVALASLALVLAAIGIYSVLAFNVRSRVGEISIRMALGARVSDVLRLVVNDGMKPALAGIILGVVGAWFLAGLLSRLIYGVSPTDPLTFGAVALLLAVVALLACLIPAWQAARVEPLESLRSE